ncbi:hypothetical protein F4604DRAFT_1817532 [Suillus subluteus]|nr:hypothetical protein F4604DRAFT_1817532 [Suillus subluteus]
MNGRFLSDSLSPNRLFAPQARRQPSSIYSAVHPSDPVIACIRTTKLEPSHIHSHSKCHRPFIIAFASLPLFLFTSLDRSFFVQQPLALLDDRAFPPFFQVLCTTSHFLCMIALVATHVDRVL